MRVSYSLGAFYFVFFVYAGLWVAYLPPYLAARGLGAAQIAWVLALPQLARIVAPAAWGGLPIVPARSAPSWRSPVPPTRRA